MVRAHAEIRSLCDRSAERNLSLFAVVASIQSVGIFDLARSPLIIRLALRTFAGSRDRNVEGFVEEGFQGREGDEGYTGKVLYRCADPRFGEAPGEILGEDSPQQDCFRDGTRSCQGTKADEETQCQLRPLIDMQGLHYENWYTSTYEISERIEAEANVSG